MDVDRPDSIARKLGYILFAAKLMRPFQWQFSKIQDMKKSPVSTLKRASERKPTGEFILGRILYRRLAFAPPNS
jgi:hypothetical protein